MSTSRGSGEFGFFSILEMPESTVDEETTEKFRTSFAFDEKEKLLGCTFSFVRTNDEYSHLFNRLPGLYFPTPSGIWTTLYIH